MLLAMLARSNLIYAVIGHMRGNREGAVGAACPQLWGRVDGAPKLSALTEKLLLFIFSFRFYRMSMLTLLLVGFLEYVNW